MEIVILKAIYTAARQSSASSPSGVGQQQKKCQPIGWHSQLTFTSVRNSLLLDVLSVELAGFLFLRVLHSLDFALRKVLEDSLLAREDSVRVSFSVAPPSPFAKSEKKAYDSESHDKYGVSYHNVGGLVTFGLSIGFGYKDKNNIRIMQEKSALFLSHFPITKVSNFSEEGKVPARVCAL